MRTYHIEKRYTVTECYRIEAEYEDDARRIAKENDIEPVSSARGSDRITAVWPLAVMEWREKNAGN